MYVYVWRWGSCFDSDLIEESDGLRDETGSHSGSGDPYATELFVRSEEVGGRRVCVSGVWGQPQ